MRRSAIRERPSGGRASRPPLPGILPGSIRRLALVAGTTTLLLIAPDAWARVGGGGSFSGGGSTGGGGSGGDGNIAGELVLLFFQLLIWLTREHPAIGVPVDVLLMVGVGVWIRRAPNLTLRVTTARTEAASRLSVGRLAALRLFDPNFSQITFSDFCYSLYARAHYARSAGDLDRYAPYLSATARNALRSRNSHGLREVREVVIGAFRVTALRGIDRSVVAVTVTFESNYIEVAEGETSYYIREQWNLERYRDILSPPPQKAKADHCPRCGAALRTRTDGACEYCSVKIETGAFQWYVRDVTSISIETLAPSLMPLKPNVPAQETSRQTRVLRPLYSLAVESVRLWKTAIGVQGRTAFEAEHPGFDWSVFLGRVRTIAVELQDAWTARDWERLRPLETDSLFQMHRYWIDAYRRQGLRNVVSDFYVGSIEPVAVTSDAFYETITVCLFVRGRDHTTDESGRVVSGSDSDARAWSEYWTLIRSRSTSSGASHLSCPHCGARVTAGSTGICEYCGGKLTAGEFDWVVSRIEHDLPFAA